MFQYVILSRFLQTDPSKPVIVAGDPEKANIEKNHEQGGIVYHGNQIKASVSMLIISIDALQFSIKLSFYGHLPGV